MSRKAITAATVICAVMVAAACFAAPRRKPVVLAFTASWCGQCQKDKPLYAKVQAKYGSLVVYDFDAHPEMVRHYGVAMLPTYIVLLSDGTEYRTHHIRELL